MTTRKTRRALVTGGASGIGAECARRLRADGVEVVVMDTQQPADLVADVADAAAVTEAVHSCGRVDVLVHGAGIVGPVTEIADVSDEGWERTVEVNLTGTFNLCRAVVPGMVQAGWGRIVAIASIAGKEGNPRQLAYSASKAGVIGLVKSLGKELAGTGVLVNAIAPGLITTPINQSGNAEAIAYAIARIPMGRPGTVAEVAELVAFLSSDRCSFSTGAVYDISGGRATY